MSSFMTGATGLSTVNYDASAYRMGMHRYRCHYTGTLNMGGSKYTAGGAAEAARTALISEIGAITDGGPA
jgi:hypothetical protein